MLIANLWGLLFALFLHVLQLLPIRFTQQTLLLHQPIYRETSAKNRIESLTSPYLVVIIESACLLILKLDTYVLPIVYAIKWKVVVTIWSRSPISSQHVCYMILTKPRTNQI